LDPRQLAVLAKGWMKSILKERVAIQAVYEGIISIDNDGAIWRHFLLRRGRRYPIPARRAEWQSQMRGKPAYLVLAVGSSMGYINSVQAHRLVWQFFRGDIPDGMEINHIDGIKNNNRPSNLELTTAQGNAIHSYTVLGREHLSGEKNPFSKLTNEAVRFISNSEALPSQLAQMFGCSETHIHRIKTRQSWASLP